MQREYVANLDEIERKNRQLQTTAESMRLSILGKDAKVKDDKFSGRNSGLLSRESKVRILHL